MSRGSLAFCGALAAVALLLAVPSSQAWVVETTRAHPYAMGFLKFAILASLGELLAIRVVSGGWKLPAGPAWRAVVWGLLGAALALLFPVYAAGVPAAIGAGLLPVLPGALGAKVATACWVSAVMNLSWGVALMLLHRLTDTWLDLADGALARVPSVGVGAVAAAIDWKGFLGFVLAKTIPLFWIPAHTVTFLLPPELRVLFAAFLSLALGAILAFAKRRAAAG
ncbi:MAG TPA: Mpv17/PMP22 family protein [Thermoanaerobaculia bacterium]|nr:Mpv17/PMP22 family protein [Thermoanaerobaculia bacterium]HQN05940.1 Mpv17/PMP22 family protein [Thermoanaerobaculia bacterium]HQP85477.1 Mpv17/PMP22 family protein [Thermoanaerobaculia bacterium]